MSHSYHNSRGRLKNYKGKKNIHNSERIQIKEKLNQVLKEELHENNENQAGKSFK